jgi:hypothetical protein
VVAEQRRHTSNKKLTGKGAEKMPEEASGFKPMPGGGVRAAHDPHSESDWTCSAMTGDRKPNPAAGKTSKADIVAALKTSF